MKIIYVFTILFISQICLGKNEPKYEILEIEITNNLPFIKLQIENQHAKCLLDTGARNQILVLSKDIIAGLTSIKPFSVKEKSMDVSGKEYIAKKYILPQFSIGDISFLQLKLVEDTNWGVGGNSFDKDGVVGLELFTDKGIIIDYIKNKLVVVDGKIPEEYDVYNWHQLTFKVDRNGVSIYTQIDNKATRRFILDTGSNVSLIKPSAVGSNEVIDDCACISPKNVMIGNLDIGGMLFYTYKFPPEFEPDGILGYNFLANKIIYIDFAKRVTKISLQGNCINH